MSNTFHHRYQRTRHNGHDYGSRLACNKNYCQPYGKEGRKRAATTQRMETKKIVHDILTRNEHDNI